MREPEVTRIIEGGQVRIERVLFREYDGYDQPLDEVNTRAAGLLADGESRSQIRISTVDGATIARVVRYETIAETARLDRIATQARAILERTRFSPPHAVMA